MGTVTRWAAMAAVWMGLAGCGGGAGGGADPGPLGGKPALKDLHFPSVTPSAGDLRFVKAFPKLGFDGPVWFAQAPGDASRAFVVEQGGRIQVFDARADVAVKKVFLDLTAVTHADGEQGLLGLAFHPQYASNGLFYVYYIDLTKGSPGVSTLSRFKVSATDPTQADAASEQKLLTLQQPFSNHNGATLAFGPDGKLYWGLGDGGSGGDPQNNAQNLNSLLGKMLRLNDDGTVPADNPFVGQAGKRPEIWALGLRNPYRFSFDRGTGQLWVGDVGQNQFEEIDRLDKGGNYGWRVREGFHAFNTSDPAPVPAPIDPVFEYDHSAGQCSITGGVIYRGSTISGLTGQYVYGDFCAGTVWALQQDGRHALANTVLGAVNQPTSFAEDSAGEIVVTSFDGNVYRLETNTGAPIAFPQKLSDTGLFTDTATLQPNAGLVEYEINAPFWSDGTRKRRWFGVAEGGRIHFAPEGAYDLPPGSATVKHFEITLADGTVRRLETRVFLRQADGWQGYTYRWNSAGTDADLLDAAQTETLTVRADDGSTRTQTYEYPSRTACLGCHTAVAGPPLGLRTAQLNRTHGFSRGSANQLQAYGQAGLFDVAIGNPAQLAVQTVPTDSTAPLAPRARSYLDVNCAQCHQPGGPTGVDLDLRRTTAIAATRTVGVAPTAGDLGVAGAQRITAGSKENSVLWLRMNRLDSNRMPPLASHVVDPDGSTLVGQWIDSGAN